MPVFALVLMPASMPFHGEIRIVVLALVLASLTEEPQILKII